MIFGEKIRKFHGRKGEEIHPKVKTVRNGPKRSKNGPKRPDTARIKVLLTLQNVNFMM